MADELQWFDVMPEVPNSVLWQCPSCGKWTMKSEDYGYVKWDRLLGEHIRQDIAEDVADFLRESTNG